MLNYILSLLLFPLICSLSGCLKNPHSFQNNQENDSHLSIQVKNITSQPLFATCFTYMKAKHNTRWKWHKSAVQALPPYQEITIELGDIDDVRHLPEILSTLAVFTTEHEAHKAIYELLDDHSKISLDRVHKLKDQTVIIGIEKYGVRGDFFDFDFIPHSLKAEYETDKVEELDFIVENKTNSPVYVTAFVYQKKEDMPTWRYDKTPLCYIKPYEAAVIDIDTITEGYDRQYLRASLAVFEEHEKEKAEHATYQLIDKHNLINIGLLSTLINKKVILQRKKYGIMGDVLEFSLKEPSSIDYEKLVEKYA